MVETRKWQYYQLDPLTDVDPIMYFRYSHGITYRLDQKAQGWVKTRTGGQITRYIALGEVGLDETTRSAVEAAVGFPLPA